MTKTVRTVLAAVVVVLAAAGYLASTWFFGNKIEALLAEADKKAAAQYPFIKISDRKYERGFFRSTETEKVSINIMGTDALSFTVKSTIKHGPILTLSGIASAEALSEVQLEGPLKQGVTGFLGKPLALNADTTFSLTGSEGKTVVTLPATSTPLLSWDGLAMKLKFATDMSHYVTEGEVAKLEVHTPDGFNWTVAGLHYDSDDRQLLKDDATLYGGTMKLAIDQMDYSVGDAKHTFFAASAKGIGSESKAALGEKESLDYVQKNTVQNLTIGGQEFGPAHFDFSVNHMDARTLSALIHQNMAMATQGPAAAQQIMTLATQFLRKGMDVKVDRLSFTTPQGEGVLHMTVNLNDPERLNFDDADGLARAIVMKMDAQAPEAFIGDLQKKFLMPVNTDEQRKAAIDGIINVGYATREGALLKTTVEYKDSQMWLNGKLAEQPQKGRKPARR